MAESADRDGTARTAAETLLNSQQDGRQSTSRNNYGAIPNARDSASNRRPKRACGGLVSDVRRMFCLLVTFDLILTVVLWGVFVQLKELKPENNTSAESKICQTDDTFQKKFCYEVVGFSFHTSLFDLMICAALRFLCLIIAYGVFRLQNPSVIAVTTFCTSLYVIVKVFIFNNYKDNPPSYMLLIISFVIAWVETWHLDCQVLPHESSSQSQRQHRGGGAAGSERESLLRAPGVSEDVNSGFCTPTTGSDVEDDDEPIAGRRNQNSSLKTNYQRIAEDAWQQAWNLLNLQEGWTRQSSVGDIIAHSQNFDSLGKVLRIEATVDASANDVFNLTTFRFSELPDWNPTVMEARIIESLDSTLEVTYSVTATAGKGMVSSRDFVNVRTWRTTDAGGILSAGCAVNHRLMPPQPQHVRGENRIMGWLFQPLPNNPRQCLLRIVVATDIKGWIPQVIVDQAITGVLVESIMYLRKYISDSAPVIL